MKAIVQERYGSLDRLEVSEVSVPAVGAGEVLVRVQAASLHPDVWHVIMGRPFVLRCMGAGALRPKQPIPGTDLAGVVESVAEGVTRFRPGDEVFGDTVSPNVWTYGGTFAELVAIPEDRLQPKPAGVTFEQAASVPSSGYIALLNLRAETEDWSGWEVLVNGAGGGVGSIALQVAKARGARVTAVDGPEKLDLLRSLGADRVLDYTREDFTRGEARYDFIFDVPGNHSPFRCRRVLKPEGRYVLIGHEGYGATSGGAVFGLIPFFLRLIFLSLFLKWLRLGARPPSFQETLKTLRGLLETGQLTPVIDRTYPLDEIREAFRHLIEDGPRGKVLLGPGSLSETAKQAVSP